MSEIINIFEAITLLGIVKWLIILLLLVYAIFAYLMMRQTGAMTRAITMRDDYVIRALAFAHLVAAGLVLVLSILIL